MSARPTTSRPPECRPRRARRAGACAAAALALVGAGSSALAGCGSSGSGTSVDPAGVVPAGVQLYVGATLRPTGSLRSSAIAAAGALTHQSDPYLRLLGLLRTPGSPPLDYRRDVAPWLGERAGLFVSSLTSAAAGGLAQSLLGQFLPGGSGTPAYPFGGAIQGAIVLDTRDQSKARSFIAAAAARAGAHPSDYRGVTVQRAPSSAFALVDRLVVIGSEAGVHGVIDTARGAPALSRAAAYAKLAALAPSHTLAHVYASPAPTGASPTSPGVSAARGPLRLLTGTRTSYVSLVPAAERLTLDAELLSPGGNARPGGLLAAGVGGAASFGELPGDAWLALGLGDAGATLGEDLQGLRTLLASGSPRGEGGAAISVKGLLEGLFAPLADLAAPTPQARRDYTSWMGPAGLFASGSGLLELKAAAVITSKDPARSRAAVGKLAAQLRAAGGSVAPVTVPGTDAAVGAHLQGVPLTLVIADGPSAGGQRKFVLGLGEASVAAALHPASALAGASSTAAARSALGEGVQPNLLLEVPTLLSLLESAGLAEDPTLAQFLPYLRSATTLAGGVGEAGGVQRVLLTLGLRAGG